MLLYGFRHCRRAQRGRPGDCGYLLRGAGHERALRFEDVEYTTTDEDGNTVTQVAENVRGVYVLYGGQLEFVQVFTDHSVNGYAICKTELSSEEQAALVTSSTIQLYDQVVVEGTDLYDGKIVE